MRVTTRAVRPVTVAVAGSGLGDTVTALADALRDRGLRVGVVTGLPAMAAAAGFPLRVGQTWETTLWLVARGISEELAARIGNDVVLVERPAPDALGHYRAALAFRRERADPEELATLLVIMHRHVESYDVLLHGELDPRSDPPRDELTRFRGVAGREVGTILAHLQVPVEPLPEPGSVPVLADRIALAVAERCLR